MSDYTLKLSDVEIARYRMMAEQAQTAEADYWTAAGIVAGATVADVGCGPGAISAVIGEIVGPTGHVWAVDRDADALAAAARAGDNVTAQPGDATNTGLEPGTFDAVMMRHVLAHNGGHEQAIVDHLATLVRPGGCIYLCDIEYGGFRARPPLPELDSMSEAYLRFHATRGNDLSVGLRLGELLTGADLELVLFKGRYDIIPMRPGIRPPAWAARPQMITEGVATDDDFVRWEAVFQQIEGTDPPGTLFVPIFCAVGRRPSG